MSKPLNLIGKKFGRLRPLRDIGRNKWGKVLWLCKCDCGNETIVVASSLTRSNTKSCGCFRKDTTGANVRTHGRTDSKLHFVWRSMKQRCSNNNNTAYHNYGGRGIKVCHAWLNFQSFYDWSMASGYKEDLTIERIDNDKGYEPRNCTWIPKGRQSDNTRRCIFITYKGQTRNLKQWAKYLGIAYRCLQSRLRYGWSIDRAFNALRSQLS